MGKASVAAVFGAFCIMLLAWGASAQLCSGSASAPALLGAAELDSMMGGVCNNQKMRTKTCNTKSCYATNECILSTPRNKCVMVQELATWECYGDGTTKDYHCTQTSTENYCAYIYAGKVPLSGDCGAGDCPTKDVHCGDAATAAQQEKCTGS